jgi:hypothetical protein
VWGVVWGVVSGVVLGVGLLGVGFIFVFFRPDNWLIGLLAGPQGRLFPRITLLPAAGVNLDSTTMVTARLGNGY